MMMVNNEGIMGGDTLHKIFQITKKIETTI